MEIKFSNNEQRILPNSTEFLCLLLIFFFFLGYLLLFLILCFVVRSLHYRPSYCFSVLTYSFPIFPVFGFVFYLGFIICYPSQSFWFEFVTSGFWFSCALVLFCFTTIFFALVCYIFSVNALYFLCLLFSIIASFGRVFSFIFLALSDFFSTYNTAVVAFLLHTFLAMSCYVCLTISQNFSSVI